MFGHQDDQQQQDSNHIPDQAIDAAMTVDSVQPTDPGWGHPGAPLEMPQPVGPTASVSVPPTAAPVTPAPAADDSGDTGVNDLLDIKQHALTELSPLVSHLEQSPDEKFRTLMMMIQASDDHTKIKDAYETAQQIGDEKARAQALLDVINEINYFTQSHDG